MGVLADIYISPDGDAARYDGRPEWPGGDRVQYKGVTPLELSTLWAIVRSREWDISMMKKFPCILEVDGGGRLIHKLPAAMLADLVTVAPERLEDVSRRWATTDELCWPQRDAREVIDDLLRLARRAAETGRGVFLWNSV